MVVTKKVFPTDFRDVTGRSIQVCSAMEKLLDTGYFHDLLSSITTSGNSNNHRDTECVLVLVPTMRGTSLD